MTSPSARRRSLVGLKYRVGDQIETEVRRSCRDEFKILYLGGPFDSPAWERIATLGEASLYEASKISPKMKDVMRVRADGMRVEGALGGDVVLAFFSEHRRSQRRHALEALLKGRP